MKIHQILPNFSYGDAIGDDTIALKRIFRELGHESDIFSGVIHPYLVDEATHWKQYRNVSSKNNHLIYHFSVGSEISEYLKKVPDKLSIIFHNITPAHWFYGVSPHMTELAVEGMRQLESLKEYVHFAVADSQYNAEILDSLGYKNIRVLPIIVDLSRLNLEPSAIFNRQYRSSQTTWVFIGRVSPNKCHQDIIRSFAVYKKHINPHSRLILAGDVRNCWRYADAMMQLVRDLGLSDVTFTGMIDDNELVALFEMADVFVCMSEHEGFCVPLLEAMHFDVPVVAFEAGAVPYTLNGAGVMLRSKDPVQNAECIHEILSNKSLHTKILAKQQSRLREFLSTDIKCEVANLLEEMVS